MNLVEGLLIVTILILIFAIVSRARKHKSGSSRQKIWDCVDRDTMDVTTVKMQQTGHGVGCTCPNCKAAGPEAAAAKENAEFFTECGNPAIGGCDPDDKFAYANNDFGAPGRDFKDWVTSQAVDPQVIKNHFEFVKDRLGDNNQNITGRTYALGEVEGTDQVPWIGIRGRPQGVSICGLNAQIPDVDYRNFTEKPRFNWNSSV